METIIKPKVELHIAEKNVTDDVSPYVSSIKYIDSLGFESDSCSVELEDTGKLWQESWYPSQKDALKLKIGYQGDMLDCGAFEIDQIDLSIPPDRVTISGVAAGITKELRTANSKTYESQTLKQIAEKVAEKHGLILEGNMETLTKISYEHKSQVNQTDLAFMSALAKEYDLIFSVRDDKLEFYTYEELEAEPAVVKINRSEVTSAQLTDKTSHVYQKASISGKDIRTNEVKQGDAESSGEDTTADALNLKGKSDNEEQAKQKADAALKTKNRDKLKGTINLPGNTLLVAGMNIELTGFGQFSGKWLIIKSDHEFAAGKGYTTKLDIRKVKE